MEYPKDFPETEAELQWFKRILNFRALQAVSAEERTAKIALLPAAEQELLLKARHISDMVPPPISDQEPYGWLVHQYKFNGWERFALILALVPRIRPQLLDVLGPREGGGWPTRHGGMRNTQSVGFYPSLETFLFVLADEDLALRFSLEKLFDDTHPFRKADLLYLGEHRDGESLTSAALIPTPQLVDLVTRGEIRKPRFSKEFPARFIRSEMDWDDLILSPGTQKDVEQIKTWMRHEEALHRDLGKRLKPGYKALFFGPPGNGKTLTACLLGKYLDREVCRIDLSQMISKYIGETEKNLERVFAKAEHSNWILFFDEADALFGARTKVSDSHDRFANQEVSYLLQRIEEYPGMVILATNMRNNIDVAFMRRFQSLIQFSFPGPEERLRLWDKTLPPRFDRSKLVLPQLADKYQLSAAQIVNVTVWCLLMAHEQNDFVLTEDMIRRGITRELAREGRTL